MVGFALPEYVTPKVETVIHIPGGSMTRSSGEHGSMFKTSRVQGATGSLGPGTYNLASHDEKYWASRGHTVSRSARDYRMKSRQTPSVGQYQVATGMDMISPRIQGGTMTKSLKGCVHYDQAVRLAKGLPDHGSLNPRRGSSEPRGIANMKLQAGRMRPAPLRPTPGPGSYELNYAQCDETVPSYTCAKGTPRFILDELQAKKAKIPAPGYMGIPEETAKVMDRQGPIKHSRNLLRDRQVRARSAR
mmetsp:Transcript_6486/g.12596  ORF Transcript_6486/g.12596 Transcript_6486/m.12596 type:complete len:246 (-) Transcript_6486:108-845(-)